MDAPLDDQKEEDVKLLGRPDSRTQNMESKINTRGDELSNLTLMMKKTQAGSSKDHLDYKQYSSMSYENSFSHCNKQWHVANRCPENPNRYRRWPNCGKMVHGPETCLSKPKAALR